MPRFGDVYGLYDPRDGSLRYVGQTTRTIEKRLQEHLRYHNVVKSTHLAHWISSLLVLGLRPRIRLLGVAESRLELDALEITTISTALANGVRLTNHTDGGKGQSGRVVTEETRAKLSAAHKGRPALHMRHPKSPATKVKLSEANLGKTHSEETRLKISLSLRGRTLSPTHKEALSNSLRGRVGRRGCRTLTLEEIGLIRLKAQSGTYTATALGLEYGVSYITVCRVLAVVGIKLKAGRPCGESRVVCDA